MSNSTKKLLEFLKWGLILNKDIIKKEWNCESNRSLGKYAGAVFLLTMHDIYLYSRSLMEIRLHRSNEFFESSSVSTSL